MKPESSKYQDNPDRLALLGYAALFCLIGFSILFYRERTLFVDIPFQTFLLINDGGFQVQVYRFGSAIVQALPLLSFKLGAPIWTILLLYSVSFPLLYLFFYWLIVRVFRSIYLGWALVFLFTLMVYDAFYWPSSEQQQGLAFLLVFFAFLLRFPDMKRPWMWIAAGLGVVTLAFYHPLIFIPFFFLWGYFGWNRPELRHWRFMSLAGFMILVLILKSQLAANWYDSGKYHTFFTNLAQDFPNYFQYPSHRQFLQNSLSYWYGFPIALFFLTVFYIYRRKWRMLTWVWGFCLGHLMLLHIGSPQSDYRFYVEVNYLPLGIYVVVPLLFEWVKPMRSRRLAFYLFLFIIGSRLIAIGLHHRPFKARWQWIKNQLERGSEQSDRYFIAKDQVPMDTLLMEWGVAYESLLLSAMEHPDSAKTLLILPDPGQYPDLFESDTLFYSGLKKHAWQELNRDYYRLGKNKYQTLE